MKAALFAILGIILFIYLYNFREAFTTQSAMGEVPAKLLLDGWYPTNNPHPVLSDLTAQDQYINKPVFSAHSPHINNLLQWRKPNNGSCSRSEMCGEFYDNRTVTLPSPPIFPSFNSNKTRVNFYNQSNG